jgi:hypothetical protein
MPKGAFLPQCLFRFMVAFEDPSTLAAGADCEIIVIESMDFLNHA